MEAAGKERQAGFFGLCGIASALEVQNELTTESTPGKGDSGLFARDGVW